MRLNHLLMVGSVDPLLRVTYTYDFQSDGRFSTVIQPKADFVSIYPSFALRISRSFEDGIFIPGKKYFPFVTLLEGTTALISKHLYEIFPNVDKTDFETDPKAIERFRTEKALYTNGMTIVPTVWVNNTNECFPGLKISGTNMNTFSFPLEDALPMVKMFNVFDPYNMGMSMLRMIGKIE